MKKTFTKLCAMAGLFCMSHIVSAQTYNAGKSSEVLGKLKTSEKTHGTKTIKVSATETLLLDINVSESNNGSERIIGSIANEKDAVVTP